MLAQPLPLPLYKYQATPPKNRSSRSLVLRDPRSNSRDAGEILSERGDPNLLAEYEQYLRSNHLISTHIIPYPRLAVGRGVGCIGLIVCSKQKYRYQPSIDET